MSKQVIVISVVFTTLVLLSSQYGIASRALQPQKKCSLQDSVCLTEQAGLLIKPFVEGDSELGLEKLDKMLLDLVEIKKDGLMYEVKNVEIGGLKNSVIKNVSVDLNLNSLKISFETSLIINGDYTQQGVLFTSPIFGSGRTTIKQSGIFFEIVFFFDIVKNQDGNDIVNLKLPIYRFVVGEAHLFYENLFNNDKEKSDKFHSLLNENSKIVTSRYGHYFLDLIIGKIFTQVKHYLASQNLKDIAMY